MVVHNGVDIDRPLLHSSCAYSMLIVYVRVVVVMKPAIDLLPHLA